ncbi:hypothetical protein IT568_12910 [bacterium]|nr:hypothetical protein [bacterium]
MGFQFKEFIKFSALCGFIFYFLMITLEALFVIKVPHEDKGWCVKYVEVENIFGNPFDDGKKAVVKECAEFKNVFEKRVDETNKKMEGRKIYIKLVITVLGILAAFAYFHLLPIWKGHHVTGIFRHMKLLHLLTDLPIISASAFTSAFFIPMILSSSLPPPEIWFLQVFYDYNYEQAQQIIPFLR